MWKNIIPKDPLKFVLRNVLVRTNHVQCRDQNYSVISLILSFWKFIQITLNSTRKLYLGDPSSRRDALLFLHDRQSIRGNLQPGKRDCPTGSSPGPCLSVWSTVRPSCPQVKSPFIEKDVIVEVIQFRRKAGHHSCRSGFTDSDFLFIWQALRHYIVSQFLSFSQCVLH